MKQSQPKTCKNIPPKYDIYRKYLIIFIVWKLIKKFFENAKIKVIILICLFIEMTQIK